MMSNIALLRSSSPRLVIATSVTLRPHVSFGSCVTSAVGTTVRNCTGDEGRPFEVGNQVLVSSHRKLLSLKAMVVSIAEKPGQDFGRHG
jgi:hypothetical protein